MSVHASGGRVYPGMHMTSNTNLATTVYPSLVHRGPPRRPLKLASTHPTGMLSCCLAILANFMIVIRSWFLRDAVT